MDELGGFEPTDTTGFIQIESIRIKKYVPANPFALHLTLVDHSITDGPKPTSEKEKQVYLPRTYTVLASSVFAIR